MLWRMILRGRARRRRSRRLRRGRRSIRRRIALSAFARHDPRFRAEQVIVRKSNIVQLRLHVHRRRILRRRGLRHRNLEESYAAHRANIALFADLTGAYSTRIAVCIAW